MSNGIVVKTVCALVVSTAVLLGFLCLGHEPTEARFARERNLATVMKRLAEKKKEASGYYFLDRKGLSSCLGANVGSWSDKDLRGIPQIDLFRTFKADEIIASLDEGKRQILRSTKFPNVYASFLNRDNSSFCEIIVFCDYPVEGIHTSVRFGP